MNTYRKLLFIIICFFLFNVIILFSEEYTNKKIGYSVDLPYRWKIIESSNPDNISFSNTNGSAVFQIFSFKGNTFNNPKKILNYFKDKLKADGEAESFIFLDNESILADLDFKSDLFRARGYFLFINGKNYDFALLSYSNLNYYEENHDYILSVLNSFSPDKKSKIFPGPVSQYYYQDDPKNKKKVKLVVWGKEIETIIDYNEIETTQVLIEREARILSKYKQDKDDIIKPWNRYYNLIYRDNYTRVKSLSSLIIKSLDINKNNPEEVVKKLVFFIQNFKFTRSGTISDMTSPLDALYSFTGDCDSRALLLLIMLHQIGIDAVLLVSTKYQHAAIGINIKGDGARINFNGKHYLFTELTKVIDIGRILKRTEDLTAWMPMKIGY